MAGIDIQTQKLHQALTLLAKELQTLTEKNEKLENALEEIFPIELYKSIRQDVVKSIGDSKKTLINHFINSGINEINLRREISKSNADLASRLTTHCLRDCSVINRKGSSQPNASHERNLRLCKTLGNPINIEKNKAHIFAKAHTLIYLKSNSICTWIPKNACSSLRYTFALGNGAIAGPEDIDWIHQNNATFSANNIQLLNADYTFVILRNPFKRLLSFFLDKLCHTYETKWDQSCIHAQKTFPLTPQSSFEDFVNYLWDNPISINNDHHTKSQCDFLVYEQYDDYLAFEKIHLSAQVIQKNTKIELKDSRQFNLIYTTKDTVESTKFSSSTTIEQIQVLAKEGLKPNPHYMYSDAMIKKIATLYLGDILLYCSCIDNGEDELTYWINKAIT